MGKMKLCFNNGVWVVVGSDTSTSLNVVVQVKQREPVPFINFTDPQKDKFYAMVFIDHTWDRIYRSTKLIGAEIHAMALWDPKRPIVREIMT